MFEIVYETRRHGVAPDSPAPPLASLVLESKFASVDEAAAAIRGFQAPYPNRWDDEARGWHFASEEGEAQYEFWRVRPVPA